MNRISRLSTLVALAGLVFGTTTTTQAAFMTGTIGLSDIGAPTIGSTSLASATQFNFNDVITTLSETGSFTALGMTHVDLGMASLNLATPGSFTLGNALFGTFTGSTVMETTNPLMTNPATSRSFMVTGTFTSGSMFGAAVTNTASFNFSFNAASTGSGTSYSDSGSLAVPSLVPEPASVAMLGMSLLGLAGYTARHRRSK